MKRVWGWILAAFVAGAALAVFVLKVMADDKAGAQLVRANATEKNAKRDIDRRSTELAALKQDTVKNAAKIARAEDGIEKRKKKLKKKFESQGLSGDEIAARFKRIRL